MFSCTKTKYQNGRFTLSRIISWSITCKDAFIYSAESINVVWKTLIIKCTVPHFIKKYSIAKQCEIDRSLSCRIETDNLFNFCQQLSIQVSWINDNGKGALNFAHYSPCWSQMRQTVTKYCWKLRFNLQYVRFYWLNIITIHIYCLRSAIYILMKMNLTFNKKWKFY